MTYHAANTYPCDPATPGHARTWTLACLREALRETSATMLLDDAALVVSELMTNSMRAGCKHTTLTLSIDPGHLRVAVTDDAPGKPRVLSPTPDDENGRGLYIVATLASDWGVNLLEPGKEVWAELSLIPARAM
jgi:anti-sigma regulatory factor (Ser/Thr protein kinase)